MSWFNDKEKRGYIGSWAYILLVFIIIGFLGFNEVPETNKDLITTIIGMLVASLGIVVYTLIGKDEDEVKEANNKLEQAEIKLEAYKQQSDAKVEIYKQETAQLREELKNVKEMFIRLQENVIDKLSSIS